LDSPTEQTRVETTLNDLPTIEVCEPALMQQETTEPDWTIEGQPVTMGGPLASPELYIPGGQGALLPPTNMTDEAMQQADDWLNEMSNIFDID
jgi:hypothetical protein